MKRYKFPKTLHAPWSLGITSDDKVHKSLDHFIGKQIVVTEKQDGENTNMYRDYFHARSIDYAHHPSRTFAKQLHAQIQYNIPEGWRVSGENLTAKHSIHYHGLPDFFLLFAIYNEENVCLSWEDTKFYSEMLGLKTVPELYVGIWDEEKVKSCFTGESVFSRLASDYECNECSRSASLDEQEGYVIRLADAFHYDEHEQSTAKFVRKNHVATSEFWLSDYIKNPVNNWWQKR